MAPGGVEPPHADSKLVPGVSARFGRAGFSRNYAGSVTLATSAGFGRFRWLLLPPCCPTTSLTVRRLAEPAA
jgi:hypothetical protein